jgi:hypothetical protein
MVTILAFLVLGGGTALAAYVVSSNSQIGPGTVSGHAGTATNKNIISGSVNATDLANQAVTAAKIKAPEAWHNVGAGSTTQNLCSSQTAVFCGDGPGTHDDFVPWANYGGGFATAAFYKDQLGIVHLKGLVSNNEGSPTDPRTSAVLRLPLGYRPTTERVFSSVGRATVNGVEVAQSRVDVQPNGLVVFVYDCNPNVTVCSGDGSYLTLDGITFRPSE